MITFLPLPTFEESARVLDTVRLGNQRAEAHWIAKAVIRGNTHPVAYLWFGHLKALVEYGKTICNEWKRRGKFDGMWEDFYLLDPGGDLVYPPWMGSHLLHSSHRANLIRKDPKHYRAFGWTEAAAMTYFWPSKDYDWSTRANDKRDDYCTTERKGDCCPTVHTAT